MRSNLLIKVFILTCIITVLGIGIFLFCAPKRARISLEIGSDAHIEKIESWYDETTKTNYLFMPSFCDVNSEKSNNSDVIIKTMENVDSLFITTATGSMDEVYNDKEHKEAIKLTLYSADGEIEFSENNSTIKGHGNSTWSKDKKPFALNFAEPVEICGLKESANWILLANAYDYSQIANAIVLDTARELCEIDNCVEYVYVNLYLNGEYNGLYMLTQSVKGLFEADERDIVLCNSELNSRSDKLDSSFSVGNGSLIGISYAFEEDYGEIEEYVKRIDETIQSNEADLNNIIDVDSWVRKYLIDEVFENYDAGITSNYFYFLKTENGFGKSMGGPMWDYDMSLGRSSVHGEISLVANNPAILLAANEYRSVKQPVLWYHDLLENKHFYDRMIELYKQEFVPNLDYWIEDGIDELAHQIESSVLCDYIRWGYNLNWSEQINDTKDFMLKRKNFLDSIWLDNTEYVNVAINLNVDGTPYLRFFVKKGETISQDPMYEEILKDYKGVKWYRESTKEQFDFDEQLYEDITIYCDTYQTAGDSLRTKLKYNWELLVGLLLFMILCFTSLMWMLKTLYVNRGKGKYE